MRIGWLKKSGPWISNNYNLGKIFVLLKQPKNENESQPFKVFSGGLR